VVPEVIQLARRLYKTPANIPKYSPHTLWNTELDLYFLIDPVGQCINPVVLPLIQTYGKRLCLNHKRSKKRKRSPTSKNIQQVTKRSDNQSQKQRIVYNFEKQLDTKMVRLLNVFKANNNIPLKRAAIAMTIGGTFVPSHFSRWGGHSYYYLLDGLDDGTFKLTDEIVSLLGFNKIE
jgi:hypothetical protein